MEHHKKIGAQTVDFMSVHRQAHYLFQVFLHIQKTQLTLFLQNTLICICLSYCHFWCRFQFHYIFCKIWKFFLHGLGLLVFYILRFKSIFCQKMPAFSYRQFFSRQITIPLVVPLLEPAWTLLFIRNKTYIITEVKCVKMNNWMPSLSTQRMENLLIAPCRSKLFCFPN